MTPSIPSDITIPKRRSSDVPVVLVNAQPNNKEDSRYEVLGEVSRGGCGIVQRAYDRRLKREVVLKKILPEIPRSSDVETRFMHEARITACLAHPGIVPVHDIGTDPDTGAPFYAMKWLQGITLADSIASYFAQPSRQRTPAGKRELLQRFEQVCKTISYAHQQGVVHRDLKPANILIGQFGETIVLDWGLAKLLPHSPYCNADATPVADSNSHDPIDSTPELTCAGSVLGTASYMSPEQARGESHLVDTRSDVFSLGSILYEILTGRSPFRCPTSQETMQHVLRVEYAPIRSLVADVPRALVAICERALNPNPDLRYCDAGELCMDLEAFFAGETVKAYREPWWGTIDRLAKKHRTIAWASFLSLSVVTVASVTSVGIVQRAERNERKARMVAEQEHAAKTVALQKEQIAHKAAVTQLQSARESVDNWILGLNSDLALYPGLNELRLHLMDRAHNHFSLLAGQESTGPMMTLEVARAKILLGEIERVNRHTDQAIECYNDALRLLDAIPSDTSSDWNAIERVQWARAKLGIAAVHLDNNKDIANAFELIEEARQAMEQIPEFSTEHAEAQRTLAQALRLRAVSSSASKQLEKAESDLSEAITIHERFSETNPLRDSQRTRLKMLDELAKYRFDRREFSLAHDTYQRIIHVYDQMLSSGRRRPDWLESRANAQVYSAACNSQLIQPNEAVSALESAEADLRNAWKIFGGEAMYHDKVSSVYYGLGHSFLIMGDSEQAERILKLSIESLQRSVVAEFPNATMLKRIVQNQIWLALALDQQHRKDFDIPLNEAEVNLNRIAAMQELDAELDYLWTQFAWLRSHHQVVSSDLEAAEKTILRELQRNPNGPKQDSAHHDLYYGRLHWNLARIYREKNELALEKKAIDEARRLWRSAHAGVGRPSAQAAFCLLQSWNEDPNLTDSDRTECKALARSMVEQHETSPNSWFWLAETNYRFSDIEEAKAAAFKLQRLRRHATPEDKLLLELIRTAAEGSPKGRDGFVIETQELKTHPGTHAWFLQQQLAHSR